MVLPFQVVELFKDYPFPQGEVSVMDGVDEG